MDPAEDELHLSKRTNRKVREQIERLFTDPNFRRDISAIKRRFKSLLRRAAHLSNESVKIAKALTVLEIKNELDPDADPKSQPPQYQQCLRRQEVVEGAIDNIQYDPKLRKAADVLTQKYNLYPQKAWRDPLISYILFENFVRPDFSDFQWQSLARGIGPREMLGLAILAAESRLREQNFAIIVRRDMKTNRPILYIQIFENTGRDDITKKNWGKIQRIRDHLFKGKGSYPIWNLPIKMRVARLDTRMIPDWQRAQLLYGENKKPSKKQIKDFQQIRSRSKKRSRTKS